MKKEDRKYMRFGKLVSLNGVTYKLYEDMSEEKETVKAVREENVGRYSRLRAWSQNSVGLTEEQRKEMEGYEEEIACDACEPANMIRFIDSHYHDLFKIRDLESVIVGDNKVYRAVYIDSTHMWMIGEKGWPNVYHICEFAEMRERNGLSVRPAV